MKTNLKYLLKSDKFIKFQQTNLKTRPEEDSDINEVNIASLNTTRAEYRIINQSYRIENTIHSYKRSHSECIWIVILQKAGKMYWQRLLLISYSGSDNDNIMSSCIFHRFIWKISSTVTEIHNLFPGSWNKIHISFLSPRVLLILNIERLWGGEVWDLGECNL